MADYNIIYVAPDDKHYLWTGSSFDLISNKSNEKLMFSGPTYGDEDLQQALNKCREVIRNVFPHDAEPDLKPVEVPISSKDEGSGHGAYINS